MVRPSLEKAKLEKELAFAWSKANDIQFGREPNYLVARANGIKPETMRVSLSLGRDRHWDLTNDLSLYGFYKTLGKALNFAIENRLTLDHVEGYMNGKYNEPFFMHRRALIKLAS